MKRSAAQILSNLDATLETAVLGLQQLLDGKPELKSAAIRNIVVFGRAVTNVAQTLKNTVEGFDPWYAEWQNRFRADPIAKHFIELRNQILKEGELGVSTAVTINGDPRLAFRHLHKPPGAVGMFVGDRLGRSGWVVKNSDGVEERFFVSLPAGPGFAINVFNSFQGLPEPYSQWSVEQAAGAYLDLLKDFTKDCRKTFG